MRLHTPLRRGPDGRIVICCYARFSTDEQRQRSITDQFAYLRHALAEWDAPDAVILEVSDEGISGEVVSRPGIDRVRELIDSHQITLLISEDSSRLFRNPSACLCLVESAVDQHIRVVCINDLVDTTETDWHPKLLRAQQRHSECNDDTRHRIRRSLAALWDDGAAIALLRPGYQRRPTKPATLRDPEEGPFYDSVFEPEAQVVRQAFERIARGDSSRLVGRWLTSVGLRKPGNALRRDWTIANVRSLIQCALYRGTEYYRRTIAVKKFKRGGTIQEPNSDPESILEREMPHLRLVDDALWFAANDAIRSRRRWRSPSHPTKGMTRQSYHPLSGILVCGVCGEKARIEGSVRAIFRCRHAHDDRCWNRASVSKSMVYERISRAIVDQILQEPALMNAFLLEIRRELADDHTRRAALEQIDVSIRNYSGKIQRIEEAIELSEAPVGGLVKRLHELQDVRGRLQADRDHLAAQSSMPATLPGVEELRAILHDVCSRLLTADPSINSALQRLIPDRIRLVPYLQLGTTKVVVRAEFELALVGLLPNQVARALSGAGGSSGGTAYRTSTLKVDLFDPSIEPRLALEALELCERPNTPTHSEVARRLGVSKTSIKRILRLGCRMREEGISDPYIRLTSRPLAVSRWKPQEEPPAAPPASSDGLDPTRAGAMTDMTHDA